MIEAIEKAKIGEFVPIYKVINDVEPLSFFEKLSDYGRNKNCVYFDFPERIIGSANPCLKIVGWKESFEITALNPKGMKFLALLKNDLKFCEKVQYSKNKITGQLKIKYKKGSDEQKLKIKTQLDVLRKIAYKFKPTTETFMKYSGLYGAFSYDIMDFFEDLPNLDEEESEYYQFFFLDNLFVYEKCEERTFVIANAFVFDNKKNNLYNECNKIIESYEKVLSKKSPSPKKYKQKEQKIEAEKDPIEFENKIRKVKKSIFEGDIYQAYILKKYKSNINSEPLDIFKNITLAKPRSYMFFINSGEKVIIGSSPEMALQINNTPEKERKVEISLIARTKPMKYEEGSDEDIENRYEAELKTDFREVSKHILAIDSVRSDVAKVSKTGSRHMEKIFYTAKYPYEQNLISNVVGFLKKECDALCGFQSVQGRLSGFPRVEAMKILRNLENEKRGYFFGTVGYITSYGEMEAAIMKNSLIIENKNAHFSLIRDITFDSIPEEESKMVDKKSKVFIDAIRKAGGLK